MTRTCIFCGSEWEEVNKSHPENDCGICLRCLGDGNDRPESRTAVFYPINFDSFNLRNSWLDLLFRDITDHLILAEELEGEGG